MDTSHNHPVHHNLLQVQSYVTAMIEAAPQPIYTISLDGLVLTWNAASARIFGWSAAEVIGRPLPIVNAAQRGEFDELRRRVVRDGLITGEEVARERRDGHTIFLLISASMVYDAATGMQSIITVAMDITEQKLAHEAVRASEVRFRTMAEHAFDVIYRYRLVPEPELEYISPSIVQLTGYHADEFYAHPELVHQLVHPDDREQFKCAIASKQAHTTLVVRILTRDGSLKWVEQSSSLVTDADNKVLALEGVARDVTMRVTAQRNLERYRLLAEHTRDIVFFVRPTDGQIIEANQAASEAYGYTHGELLQMTMPQLRAPETQDLVPQQMAEALKSGIIFETRHQRKDGTYFPVEVSASSAMIDGETIILSVVRDVSMRHQAMHDLELLRTALNVAATAMVITDLNGMIEWANPAFTALTGYNIGEVMGRKTSVLRSGHHDTAFYTEMWQTVLSGKVWRGELINKRKDGSLYSEEMTITPVLVDDQLSHFVAIKQEITSRVERDRERQALLTLVDAMRNTSSRLELLPTLLAQTCILVGVEATALAMRDPRSGETVFELGLGPWVHLRGLRLPAGVGVSGHVMETGALYHCNDLANDPSIQPAADLNGVQAGVCAPLRTDDTIIGVLWAGRTAPISEAEARLVGAIADLAASTLYRVTLIEQTERRLQRLTSLRSIDRAITSSFDVRLTLDFLVEQTIQQLGVDAAAVLLLHPHTLTLEYHTGRGFRTGLILTSRVRIGEGLAGRAALERRTIIEPHLTSPASIFLRKSLIVGEGFEVYIVVPLIAKGQVRGVLEVFQRTPLELESEWLDFLETLAGQAAVAVDNAELFERMQRANLDVTLAYDTTLEGWSRALELRDKETEGHSQRVTEMTVQMARAMGISEEEIVHIRRGALLHDIGKMGIPDAILLKPGPLTEPERDVINLHPGYAYELLRPIPFLRQAIDIPYCHHEKWNGTGYPRGLRGLEIPLAARIFAVADVYDAVTSDRPYQRAWRHEKAIAMIREEVGAHFDPDVVTIFLQLYE
ncbi:PAS domain S-box protein [Candidatus Chloroploca sp. M-50]|uniref:PAS domain S-box protein n=1 Tax=Candidatus Chloroploca mongolica TaxID=2528176 RepID=A0ABS4DA70_9CHLR|nr:PAS domain S-box protein [Candidatus Chloroploca mongolica]MBP1466331.1 PAS domain S-box protein [Candidatus Chloroploca mongolica]